MEFVLTTYGENLLQNSGTPVSLVYVLGSSYGYTPVVGDTNIHGTTVGTGTTLAVQGFGINQPSYPILLGPQNVPDAAFGEVGLFLGDNLVALGVNPTAFTYQGLGSMSVLCVLPPIGNEGGLFSPVAATGQNGIDYLPSLDSLPRATNAAKPGVANIYGFLNDDIVAASGGQWWRLVGTNLVQRTQVSSPIATNTINLAAALPGNPSIGTKFYVSIGTGANAGLVRSASLEASTTIVLNVPLPYEFAIGDWIYVYNVTFVGSGNSGSGVNELAELIDVQLTNPQDGDVLSYSVNDGKWINIHIASGGNSNLTVQEI